MLDDNSEYTSSSKPRSRNCIHTYKMYRTMLTSHCEPDATSLQMVPRNWLFGFVLIVEISWSNEMSIIPNYITILDYTCIPIWYTIDEVTEERRKARENL
ncbi:hypothetical protein V1477_016948 [Vespula maculifrons]|uniref:Uncharacterized protein n=1 Tax=Vespula maculifrons TaxID=7453 RepID=A0ABD2B4L9_VESMC